MKNLHLIFFLITSNILHSQDNPPSQMSLDGFYLSQYRYVFTNLYGKPLQIIKTEDGWIYEFFKVKPDTSVYILTKASSDDTTAIISIQINGEKYDEMIPFLGLKLGDDEKKVFNILGKYSEVTELDNPHVEVGFFKDRNYSIEINDDKKLYGLRIFGFDGFKDLSDNEQPDLLLFKKAILAKDIESLSNMIMPNFKIFRNDEVYYYKDRIKKELSDSTSDIHKQLFNHENSLYNIFKEENPDNNMEIRLTMDPQRVMLVAKFPDSKFLKEIVFWGHVDRYKVWEISFKDGS